MKHKGGINMLQHFQFKPLYNTSQLPGWTIHFYFEKQRYDGVYHQDGKIEWTHSKPPAQDLDKIKSQIHELMLFHVYE